jgi:hypothetical protein
MVKDAAHQFAVEVSEHNRPRIHDLFTWPGSTAHAQAHTHLARINRSCTSSHPLGQDQPLIHMLTPTWPGSTSYICLANINS